MCTALSEFEGAERTRSLCPRPPVIAPSWPVSQRRCAWRALSACGGAGAHPAFLAEALLGQERALPARVPVFSPSVSARALGEHFLLSLRLRGGESRSVALAELLGVRGSDPKPAAFSPRGTVLLALKAFLLLMTTEVARFSRSDSKPSPAYILEGTNCPSPSRSICSVAPGSADARCKPARPWTAVPAHTARPHPLWRPPGAPSARCDAPAPLPRASRPVPGPLTTAAASVTLRHWF